MISTSQWLLNYQVKIFFFGCISEIQIKISYLMTINYTSWTNLNSHIIMKSKYQYIYIYISYLMTINSISWTILNSHIIIKLKYQYFFYYYIGEIQIKISYLMTINSFFFGRKTINSISFFFFFWTVNKLY